MLFQPGHSALHRACPLTKLALVAAVAAMLPLWPAPVLLAAGLLCLGAGVVAGLGRAMSRRLALLLAPLALALLVVQGMLIARGTAAQLGPLAVYPEGVAIALLVLARLALLLAVCLLVVMTTRPNDLARAFDGAGLPPSLSYLLTAPLSLIGSIADDASQVRDSLQLRGMSPLGGLRARIRLLSAMTIPVMRNLITEAPARAELLEMRGFRALPRRGLLNPRHVPRPEIRLRRGLVLLAALQLAMLAL